MAEVRIDRVVERIMVTGSGCALLATLAAFDDTVRGRLFGVFTGSAPSELSMAGAQLQRVMRMASESIGYSGTEHATLVYFAVAAVVLFGLMLRT
jgi:hypothetical protein